MGGTLWPSLLCTRYPGKYPLPCLERSFSSFKSHQPRKRGAFDRLPCHPHLHSWWRLIGTIVFIFRRCHGTKWTKALAGHMGCFRLHGTGARRSLQCQCSGSCLYASHRSVAHHHSRDPTLFGLGSLVRYHARSFEVGVIPIKDISRLSYSKGDCAISPSLRWRNFRCYLNRPLPFSGLTKCDIRSQIQRREKFYEIELFLRH